MQAYIYGVKKALPGGFEKTVVPQVVNALLSRHDFILLGLRGQAKTRILRQLSGFLDDFVPVISGCPVNDNPFQPFCARCRRLSANTAKSCSRSCSTARRSTTSTASGSRARAINRAAPGPGSACSSLASPSAGASREGSPGVRRLRPRRALRPLRLRLRRALPRCHRCSRSTARPRPLSSRSSPLSSCPSRRRWPQLLRCRPCHRPGRRWCLSRNSRIGQPPSGRRDRLTASRVLL